MQLKVAAVLCELTVCEAAIKSTSVLLRLADKPTVGSKTALACSPFDKLAVYWY
jgi:hypothetical protein